MKSDQKIKEPILVINPNTGRHVNVAPLFDAMRDVDGKRPDSVSNLKDAVSRTIRHVNLNGSDENTVPGALKTVTFDLYLLEDMFTAMSEYNG